MILSGQGKQTCAVSGGGEGVHPTLRPRQFRQSMLAASTATAGTSVSGGIYGSGRTDGRADGRAVGRAAARLARTFISPKRHFYLQKSIFISNDAPNVFWR